MARRTKDPDKYVMSFGDHIEELRRHLILAIIGVGVALGVTLWWGRWVIAFIYVPLQTAQKMLHLPAHTFSQSTIGPLTVYLGVALKGALVVSAPWVMYQLWLFVAAGLYEAERKAATFLVSLSVVMTALGLALTYYLFLPATIVFMLMFSTSYPIPHTSEHSFMSWVTQQMIEMNRRTLLPGGEGAATEVGGAAATGAATLPGGTIVPTVDVDPEHPRAGEMWFNRDQNELRIFEDGRVLIMTPTTPSMMVPMIDPKTYLDEVTLLALAVVAVFHVPVVMCVLGMTGLVNPAKLWGKWKYVLFGCFVASVFLTPSQDLFSNIVLPLMAFGLYVLGLVLMGVFYRRRQRAIAAEDARYAAEEAAEAAGKN